MIQYNDETNFYISVLPVGGKSPYRMKMRPMGLTLTGALDPMLRGQKIADLITTGAAIDFVIPDIDR